MKQQTDDDHDITTVVTSNLKQMTDDVSENIKVEEAILHPYDPSQDPAAVAVDIDDPQALADAEATDAAILPSVLSAEVAAAAAVAASLNQDHNDLLLSSEIAQIAAESAEGGNNNPDSGSEPVPPLDGGNHSGVSHEQHLASRRRKDRERYASMSQEEREAYNKKRREQYHRQSEESRRKRRERERKRYHALSTEKAKERNARRASLERERYKKLSPNELAERNAKRRERAAMLRAQKKGEAHQAGHPPPPDLEMVPVYDYADAAVTAHNVALEHVVSDTVTTERVADDNEESVAV